MYRDLGPCDRCRVPPKKQFGNDCICQCIFCAPARVQSRACLICLECSVDTIEIMSCLSSKTHLSIRVGSAILVRLCLLLFNFLHSIVDDPRSHVIFHEVSFAIGVTLRSFSQTIVAQTISLVSLRAPRALSHVLAPPEVILYRSFHSFVT